MIPAFDPKSGFSWKDVRFDHEARDKCGYCDGPLEASRAPRCLFDRSGAVARFCEACSERWFGWKEGEA